GLYEIAEGIITLAAGAGIIAISHHIPDIIEPEILKSAADDRIKTTKQMISHLIDDPMRVVEGMGQSIFDAAEDEGIMYVTGYASTSFVPMAGQGGRGRKGIYVSKAASNVSAESGHMAVCE